MPAKSELNLRPLLPVIVFTGIYMVAAVTGAIIVRNLEFIFYSTVMLFLIGMVVLVHRRVDLSRGALWCLSLWGFAHLAGGLVKLPAGWPYHGDSAVLYSWWLIPERLKYDQVVHTFGFAVTTWVCWQGLRAATGIRRPTFGVLVLCGAAGMGFGAMNEVIEFAATILVPETNVGGYMNTGWDLVANLVGVVIASVLIGLTGRASSNL